MWAWLLQILIAFDQQLNTLIPGGWADETLSSRAHRMRLKGQPVWGWTANAIDWMFFWQPAHCAQAYADEADRLQLPPELRGTPAAPTVDWPAATPYIPPGVDPGDR
jgi:hypothetical protein